MELKTKREDLLRLVRSVKAGDDQAWKELARAHQGLIEKLVAHFRHRISGADDEDLRQAARIGLLKAARTFDEERDCKFSTYAWWRIRGALGDVLRNDPLIRAPQTRSLISREIKPPVVASIDQPIPDASDVTLGEAIVDPMCLEDTVLARLEAEQLLDQIAHILEQMSEVRRQCFVLRFGLDGGFPRSFREIGRLLSRSPGSVKFHTNCAIDEIKRRLCVEER